MIKKYKKILMILMSLVLIMVGMIGCGDENIDNTNKKNDNRSNILEFAGGYYNIVDILRGGKAKDLIGKDSLNRQRKVTQYAQSIVDKCPDEIKEDFTNYIRNHDKCINAGDKFLLDDIGNYNDEILKNLGDVSEKLVKLIGINNITLEEINIERERNPIIY